MAEFKLICPGCGAEYALPPGAIPPTGREVECSDCGHVWQARPAAPEGRLDLGGFARSDAGGTGEDAPRPLPPAARRLPADVLDILRDEVEHERRLRAAEQQAVVRPPVTPPDGTEIDWPATTLTREAEPEPRPAAPTVIRHARNISDAPPAQAARSETPPPAAAPTRRQDPTPVAPEPAQPAPPAPAVRAPRRGRVGFLLGLGLAGAVLAVYLATPLVQSQGGPLADLLGGWRADLDALRLWLAERIGGA